MRSALADDTLPEIANPPETARPRPRLVPPAPVAGTRGPVPVRSPVAPPRAPSPQPLVGELAEEESAVRRKSYAAAPKPVRPMSWNGAPPTVIRDIDALFAKDRANREAITSRPPAPAPVAAAAPIDPAYFAQQLLQKVQADFTPAPTRAPREALLAAAPPGHSPPLASASARTVPSPLAAPRVPSFVAFMPTPTTLPFDETVQLALPDDDEDLARLVPWYRRLWSKLFG